MEWVLNIFLLQFSLKAFVIAIWEGAGIFKYKNGNVIEF